MDAEARSLDMVTFGETMVQLVPQERGRLRHATRFHRRIGGAESNTAIALSRLGHRAGWASRVGDDEFGACVRAFVAGEGVDTTHVIADESAPTAVYFKERRGPGGTNVYYYREASAGSRLSPGDLDPDYVASADYLLVTGITLALSPSCRKTVEHAIDVARVSDVRVVLDPNVRRKLWDEQTAREVLLELVGDVDCLLATRDELELLTGLDDVEEASRTVQDRGVRQVVVRMGEEGAVAFEGSHRVDRPAMDVEAVEPVGAGDAFNAGFLSGQLRGWSLDRSVRLGTVLGGLAVTVPGDVEGLPTRAEADAYLDGLSAVDR